MGVLSDLINGTVEVTKATAETTVAELYSAAAAIGIFLILVFLLILFFVEPVSATILTVLLIVAVAYILTSSDTEII